MSEVNKNYPRDVFMYILSIVALVVVAVSFGILAFQYINVYIPDVVSDYYFSRTSYLDSIRNSMATLIITFPVFLWASRFLRNDIAKYPEKRDLKIRKWLLYLTLFSAAVVIIGDLVALLRSFLGGELTSRFILKVLTVLFIAGSVFIHYYLSELKDKVASWVKAYDKVVISVVVIGIVAGFFVIGSPTRQRDIRLDERRISDLQNIQWQVINYWQRKGELPNNLDQLRDDISGFVAPVDPQTGENYEYRTLDNLIFQLCAEFLISAEASRQEHLPRPVDILPKGETSFNWSHPEGIFCFDRTIDPDLYPLLER